MPDGTYPMLFTEINCVCMQCFKFVAPSFFFFFFFFGKKKFFFFMLEYRKGCGYIDLLIMFL